jgi:hypothetical protein
MTTNSALLKKNAEALGGRYTLRKFSSVGLNLNGDPAESQENYDPDG